MHLGTNGEFFFFWVCSIFQASLCCTESLSVLQGVHWLQTWPDTDESGGKNKPLMSINLQIWAEPHHDSLDFGASQSLEGESAPHLPRIPLSPPNYQEPEECSQVKLLIKQLRGRVPLLYMEKRQRNTQKGFSRSTSLMLLSSDVLGST